MLTDNNTRITVFVIVLLLVATYPMVSLGEERQIYMEGDGHIKLEKDMILHWKIIAPEPMKKKSLLKTPAGVAGDAEECYERGYDLLNNKEMFDEALEAFNKALDIDPEYVNAYVYRAAAFAGAYFRKHFNNVKKMDLESLQAKDLVSALEPAFRDFERAIELDPENTNVYSSRGGIYAIIGHFKKAITDLSKAIRLDPDNAEAYTNRGFAYMMLKDMRAAVKDFDKAITNDPNYALAYKNRGTAHLGLNDIEGAVSDYSRLIELAPQDPDGYLNRGMAHMMAKDNEEACSDFKKACDLGNCEGLGFGNMSGICGQ